MAKPKHENHLEERQPLLTALWQCKSERKLTLEALARQLQLSYGCICSWRYDGHTPSIMAIGKIKAFLGPGAEARKLE